MRTFSNIGNRLKIEYVNGLSSNRGNVLVRLVPAPETTKNQAPPFRFPRKFNAGFN